jgi:glycosyltransferase involved in cell wall biosynthesis
MVPPEVTVVIPAHNRTAALRNCLASLARQTLARDAFEVIVVDDGSTPPIAADIAEFVDGEHTKLLRHEHAQGAGQARNSGAASARGELLVFLDADCLCHPGLLRAHLDAQADGPVAVCGFGGGRELTPSTWRLKFGPDWDFSDVAGTFAAAARTPLLHDPLTELLARPRPTDWAFFWTLNAAVPKSFFDRAGGFNPHFEVKGNEDMELGYRLSRIGLATVFVPEAITIHQPHDRNRNVEVVRDRRNEHILVREYPNVEVEAVCSYDIVRSRELIPAIGRFVAKLAPETADCARLAGLPELTGRLATASGPVFLAGSPEGWPAHVRPPDTVCYPSESGFPGPARHLPLLGTRLPGEDKHFELGLITDYWRHFPEGTFSRILAELHRTCREVFVLSGVSTSPAGTPDPELSEALATHDHPYWEFTTPLRRELHQFELAEVESSGGGQVAFRCAPIPWPATELAELG